MLGCLEGPGTDLGHPCDASSRTFLLRGDLSARHRAELRQLDLPSEDACPPRVYAASRNEDAADRQVVDCGRVRRIGSVRMHGSRHDDRADLRLRQGGRPVVAGRRRVCGCRRSFGDWRRTLVVQLGVSVRHDLQFGREGDAVQEQGGAGVRELPEVLRGKGSGIGDQGSGWRRDEARDAEGCGGAGRRGQADL